MKLLTHDVYKDIIALKFTNGYIFIVDLKTSLMPYKKRTFAGDDDEEEVVVMESEYEKVNNEDLIYLGHNKDKLNAERLYSFKLIFVNQSAVIEDAHFYLNNITQVWEYYENKNIINTALDGCEMSINMKIMFSSFAS